MVAANPTIQIVVLFFQLGDTKGVLQGTTLDGARFEGSDLVKIDNSAEQEKERAE